MSGLNQELQAPGRAKSGVATLKIGSSALYIGVAGLEKYCPHSLDVLPMLPEMLQ